MLPDISINLSSLLANLSAVEAKSSEQRPQKSRGKRERERERGGGKERVHIIFPMARRVEKKSERSVAVGLVQDSPKCLNPSLTEMENLIKVF